MHNLNYSENNDQKEANIRQLFDSILTGKITKSGALKNGVKWYKSNCPLPGHLDKNPSFNFNYSGGWTCFACNKKGDAVLLAKELSLDPKPYYNNSTDQMGLISLPRFDDRGPLKVAHRNEYKYVEDITYFRKTLNKELYNKNNLALYYKKKFGKNAALLILGQYLIGTGNNGSAIYWYADYNNNLCLSKTMQYDRNGHKNGLVTTDYYGIPDRNRKKPLYGEWLARKYKKSICIHESEKTASVMSIYDRSKVHLATGGVSYLDLEALNVYGNRELIFYPDVDAHQKWCDLVKKIKPKKGQNIEVQDTSMLWKLDNLDVPPKGDCADYHFDYVDIRYDPEWNNWLKENQHLVGPMGLSRN